MADPIRTDPVLRTISAVVVVNLRRQYRLVRSVSRFLDAAQRRDLWVELCGQAATAEERLDAMTATRTTP
ncbi:MAG: hypothetical protein M3457_09490 [Chloroflexota bacterium]|nr:hypothetical protein [Chloroflexota bacterium]